MAPRRSAQTRLLRGGRGRSASDAPKRRRSEGKQTFDAWGAALHVVEKG